LTVHQIERETYHYLWDNERKPVVHIQPGDRVHFKVNEVTSWQITRNAKLDDLIKLDLSKLYPLSGPVFVEGASEGDGLAIEVEEIRTENWGWSAIVPGLGLLPEFTEHYLWIWNLSKSDKFVDFKNGVRVPLSPFCGVMGVAPKEKGALSVLPPGKHGGNMDIKHLTVGSKLILPVWTKGALFSVGDLHAAMGDGEVCISAIECPGEVRLKFDLIKNANIPSPRFITKEESNPSSEGSLVATGIAPDLMEACKLATRNMIDYLVKEHDLSRNEAYILCSVAADLRIHEVVDAPNWVVGLWMSRDILGLH
jgi:acetamidase/formamidase